MGQAEPANYKTEAPESLPLGSLSHPKGTTILSQHPSGTSPPPPIRKCHSMALRALWVEGTAKLAGVFWDTQGSLLQHRAETSELGCSSWARQGPLLRRRGWARGFLLLKPKLLKLRKFLARLSGASNKLFITGCKRSQLQGPELEPPGLTI